MNQLQIKNHELRLCQLRIKNYDFINYELCSI